MTTINAMVRAMIRLGTDRVPDSKIEEKIGDAEVYVERDTDLTITISSLAAANTGDLYLDELIAYRTAWAIYVELFQTGVLSQAPDRPNTGVFITYEQTYLEHLAVEYPQKVDFASGRYIYATASSGGSGSGSGGGVGYADTYSIDNRYDDPTVNANRTFEEV